MRKIFFLLILSVTLCFYVPSAVYAEEAVFRLHFIDAGEGEATLIETASGKSALIDTGNLITGYRVNKYLEKQGIHALDYLILTHPHPDHMGGSFLITQTMSIQHIHDNAQDLGDDSKKGPMYRWYEQQIRGNRHYSPLEANNNISLDTVKLKVLWPEKLVPEAGFNANSLVIMVTYKKFHALLAGDITMVAEAKLCNTYALNADVLKVPHHGFEDATSQALVDAVSPKISIVSINRNHRKYPSPSVMKRLQDAGSITYTTFEDGTIIISVFEDGTYTVVTTAL